MAGTFDKASGVTKEMREWAMAQSPDGQTCPLCLTYKSPTPDKRGLTQHLRLKHATDLPKAYKEQTMDIERRSESALEAEAKEAMQPDSDLKELMETAGIGFQDDLTHINMLEINPEYKSKVEKDGSKFKWVSDRNLPHWKRQGASDVTINDMGDQGYAQASSEDGKVKTGDLNLLRVPSALVNKRAAINTRKADTQLQARAEDVEKTRDEHEKATYDFLRSEKNLDHNVASQVARALTSRRQRENFSGRSPDAHHGFNVSHETVRK
tara:strand:+ start:34 stop:834 length:801 start_codon:yes stop_codon:yes gene_type:complete